MSNAPANPAGKFTPAGVYDELLKQHCIESLRQAPARLREAVRGLTDGHLDTKYKNWTIRQIVHHLADSHVHSYIRFKWTLSEDIPTIKAYEEDDWVQLDDSTYGDVRPALALVEAMHAKWVQVLETMNKAQFARTFVHPQSGATVSLWEAVNYYPWHCRHHIGQILWLREEHGW